MIIILKLLLGLNHLFQQGFSDGLLLHVHRDAVGGPMGFHIIQFPLIGSHSHHPLLPNMEKRGMTLQHQDSLLQEPDVLAFPRLFNRNLSPEVFQLSQYLWTLPKLYFISITFLLFFIDQFWTHAF